MKTNKLIITLIAALSYGTVGALAQGGGKGDLDQTRDQLRTQDRLQDCSPILERDRTRLHQSLPAEVNQAVQDMKKAREQYQQQKREQTKAVAGVTDQERERLRDQLRDMVKEQVRDRAQLRERLQELRECLPSHQELMAQAREQTHERERRGD